MVGVESALFLANQLTSLKHHLASLLDNTQAVGMFDTKTMVILSSLSETLEKLSLTCMLLGNILVKIMNRNIFTQATNRMLTLMCLKERQVTTVLVFVEILVQQVGEQDRDVVRNVPLLVSNKKLLKNLNLLLK